MLASRISVLLYIGLLSLCSAQARQVKPTANLTIHVHDISGAFVPQAHIELIDVLTSSVKKLETDYKGDLSIDLPFGNYDLTASYEGFRPAEKRINVPDNTDQTITLVLNVAPGNLAAIEAGLRIAEPTGEKLSDKFQGDSSIAALTEWHKLDAGPFSLFTPLGWEFHQLPGFDSYVGEFAGDGVLLRFDFGEYSNPLKKEKKPVYVVVHKTIGGVRAKIVSPRTPGDGLTGAYFGSVGHSNRLCLWAKNLTSAQQELVMKIFDTIRFGGPVPRYVIPPPPQERKVM